MSTKDLNAFRRRFVQECNKGKTAGMAVIDELCVSNVVFHGSTDMDIRGPKGFRQYMSSWFDAFPDGDSARE